MAVPFSYPSNMTGLVSFFNHVNTLVEGFLGAAILIMIGMVAFLSTKHYSFERAFGFSAFLMLVVSVFLRFLDLINDWILAFTIFLFIGALLTLMRERSVESV